VLPGKTWTASDVARIAKRRGWMIIVPFSIGLALVPVLSRRTPNMYRSETLIRVIPQRVPDSVVRQFGVTKMEERLPTIRDLLLSRTQLEPVVKAFNLYPRLRNQRSIEEIVQRMRSDINLQAEGQETFRLEYISAERYVARDVTARLASLLIEENLRDRAGLADETNQFLESQLNAAKEQLIQHEKRLEMYRRLHSGELPSQLESNLQAIRNAQQQLQAVGESTNRAQERRLLIERQLADTQALPADVVVPVAGEAAPAGPAPLTTAQQLETARTQLEANRMRYTADHPDVRAGERTVRDLMARLEEESKQQQQAPQSTAAQVVSPAQAARQKRISDLRAEMDVIDHQITAGDTEAERLKRTIADYQSKVDAVPTRESELVELTRDYSTLQTTYMSLLTKREDSKIAANLQRRESGEQFRIVDPASLPEKPYNQVQRMGIIAAGAVAGLVSGVLLVALLAFTDSSFRREEDVVRTLSLPVLALVPVMGSSRELRMKRLRAVAGNLIAAAALIGSLAFVAFWRLHR
jgi:polysaccharide chain length determinant protein (PEP-CTERM system associated)